MEFELKNIKELTASLEWQIKMGADAMVDNKINKPTSEKIENKVDLELKNIPEMPPKLKPSDITIENNPNFSTPRVLPIIRRVNADSIPPATFAAPRILKLFINLLARSL